MTPINRVTLTEEDYAAPVTGLYRVSILALAKDFGDQGLHQSNANLARFFHTDVRTIERAIAGLKRDGFLIDTGTGRNDRCLIYTDKTTATLPTKLPVSDTDNLTGKHPTKPPVPPTDKVTGQIPTKLPQKPDKIADHNIRVKEKNDRGKKFSPPTPAEVTAYGESIGFPYDGEAWVDHYNANGWMVGKNKMKDWKATLRTWKHNHQRDPQKYPLITKAPESTLPRPDQEAIFTAIGISPEVRAQVEREGLELA